ncbi:uncharacterized protein KGF55_002108 [Candida pseudojiufengensis]|uniref:uncharacterized protein n=1 Tax=Candida pseudojiufengensis TaxID=497109 RepID=UPI0022258546|nr:uncharacterized protein KGF55_002108 [Candida pseudojiufengensis]KAI5964166.1 hypothetical protein KGF55_002108 [Candida pseudojiufengensis]
MSSVNKSEESSSQQLGITEIQKVSKWQNFKDSFKRADTNAYNNKRGSISSCCQSINKNDLESQDKQTTNNDIQDGTLHRELKNKHIQMIALGGSVGTGLLIGSGGALREGGPASLIIAWGLVGTMVYCTIFALGELCVAFPVNGAFSQYASRFVDESWGFAVGWNYAIMWLIVLPLELVAASMCITYWNDSINPASWVAIFYLLIVVINLFGVKGYGEAEYWLTIFKIIAIIGFIILGVVLVVGGGPKKEFIGASNWKVGKAPFPNGFKGLATTFVTASYSMAGSEMCGIAASETKNPAKTLPRAVRQVFWRLFLFFFLSLTMIGLLVPYNSPDLLGNGGVSSSPFVIAIKDAGIQVLPSIFNACILISVISVGNSAVYGCSRTIQSLGQQGLAPSLFAYVDRKGRPLAGLILSAIFGLLCFLAAYKDQDTVFAWLLSVSGLATIFSWFNIGLCHLRFRMAMHKQGKSLEELSFTSSLGIYGSIYSMSFLVLVLVVQFWVALFPLNSNGKANAESFFKNYLGAVVILIFYLGHKILTKNWKIYKRLDEIDLDSGRRQIDVEIIQSELFEEKQLARQKPLYIKIFNYWC